MLYNDDCFNIFPKIEDKSIDMILCDLPYGMTANKWDSVLPLDALWNEYNRMIKDNGVVCLTASQPFTSVLVTSNIGMFRHEWIWHKDKGGNFANTVREPMKEHESVLIFSKGKWTYNKQMQERAENGKSRVKYDFNFHSTSKNYHDFNDINGKTMNELRVPSSVQYFTTERGFHPTQKPVALLEYLIKTYTNEGETVLDNCMGSGSTGVACANLNRRFIGIEKDAEYFRTATDRINKASSVKRLEDYR